MSAETPIVFVVDDDRSVRDSLRRLITSVGMTVEVFPSAQEFLSTPRGNTPGCLVLDVRLPGMSGLDLQRELANTNAPLPIIFLTGHGDIPMSVRAMKTGAIEFLTKPFRAQDLLDAIRHAVDRDRAARTDRQDRVTHVRLGRPRGQVRSSGNRGLARRGSRRQAAVPVRCRGV
jgi:FixJ family two-component response regulator